MITSPTTMTLRVLASSTHHTDTAVLHDVTESRIETVVPTVGHKVMILTGEHRHEIGTVIERDTQKQQCVVQVIDDMDVATYNYDDVCQYQEV